MAQNVVYLGECSMAFEKPCVLLMLGVLPMSLDHVG